MPFDFFGFGKKDKKTQKPKPAAEPKAKKPVEPQKPETKPKPPVDLKDPEVVTDEKTKQKHAYGYQKNTRGAKLYGPNGVQAGDVRQGSLGDCYLAAAISAIAGTQPDAITSAIKDNADGTYSVRFYEVDYAGNKKAVTVQVDADLPMRADPVSGGDMPAYAKSTETVDGKAFMELWPSVLEKAYAQWKGSYDTIGHGGVSGDVMTALTGKASRQSSTGGASAPNDPLWDRMKKATADKKSMTAGSGGEEDPRYKDPKAGVYGWHAYTVLGVEEKSEGGKPARYVTLRNPWSKRRRDADAAAAGDTTNNTAGGVFQLTWDEFRRLYDDVTING